MKVTILYASRRGSTRQIVDWMSDYFNDQKDIHLEVLDIGNGIDNVETDLLLIGYPIYFERPWKPMSEWMKENVNQLNATHVAMFILGWAKSMYKRVEGHILKNYFGPIEQHFSNRLISKHMFRGWIRKMDFEQKGECEEWIREVLDTLYSSSTL